MIRLTPQDISLASEFSFLTPVKRPYAVLQAYSVHYHTERNHQGKGNLLLFAPAMATNI
jgi:hypothetical protein